MRCISKSFNLQLIKNKYTVWHKIRQAFKNTISFFPVYLVFLHLRRSYFPLLFWVLLFSIVTSSFAKSYGIPYLFLTPEYMDVVGFRSYFILGLAAGLFIMSFHISSYIYYSYKFPFLATLERPLYKFSINNSIIPIAFFIIHIYQIIILLNSEGYSSLSIFINVIGIVLGVVTMIFLCFTYFFTANRNVLQRITAGIKKQIDKPLDLIIRENKKTTELNRGSDKAVNTYLKGFTKIKATRGTLHYKKSTLLQILQQHHRNAAIFFVVLVILFIVLSVFRESRYIMIPAGASIFILLTIYLMITGAIYSRFKGWSITVITLLAFGLNYLSGTPLMFKNHYAYGLNYKTEKAEYSNETLNAITTDSIQKHDRAFMLEILENWKEKNGTKKPKLIIVNTSGGGLRSAVWTFAVLQQVDSIINGSLFNKTHLITGSSGGMVGAAYLRELYKLKITGKLDSYYHDSLQQNIGKDILNPVVFSAAVNDLFFNLLKFNDGEYTYTKDRGYAFENKLNENTNFLLDKRISDFKEDEYNSKIPMMIFSPTIVSDGRRLIISPQPLSYLSITKPVNNTRKTTRNHDGIEFSRMFAKQDAKNLKYTSALRMSASFPYITPMVNLPSTPSIELIDAGVRDNNGFELSLRFLYNFRHWIEANTSGVVFIQVQGDRYKNIYIEDKKARTTLGALTRPVGGVVKSFDNLQTFNNAKLIEQIPEWYSGKVNFISFQLIQPNKQVSLSWHLTEKEKKLIADSFYNEYNQNELKKLLGLIGD